MQGPTLAQVQQPGLGRLGRKVRKLGKAQGQGLVHLRLGMLGVVAWAQELIFPQAWVLVAEHRLYPHNALAALHACVAAAVAAVAAEQGVGT